MIKRKFRIIYLAIFYFLSFESFANIENSIVLKVDDQIITSYEIKNKILSNLILSGKEFNQKNINALKKQSLESLIQLTLKRVELSKYNFIVSDQQINQYLNSISSNNIQNLKKLLSLRLALKTYLEFNKKEKIKPKRYAMAKFKKLVKIKY